MPAQRSISTAVKSVAMHRLYESAWEA